MRLMTTQITRTISLWFLVLTASYAAHLTSAAGQTAPLLRLPTPPLSDAAMRDAGWELRKFDFSNPSVDFSAWLPSGASLQTAPLPATPLEPGSVGRTLINAEYVVPTRDGDITGKAITLTTPYPAATEPVCIWLLQESGFEIVKISRTQDLTRTQLAGVKDRGRSGVHATCYARGRITLALVHSYEAEAGASEDKMRNLARAVEDIGTLVADPIVFANGRSPWLDEAAMKRVSIDEGEAQWYVLVPDGWPVALNEFAGKLPGRLMLGSINSDRASHAVGFAIIQRGDAQLVEKDLAGMALRMFKQDFITSKTMVVTEPKISKVDDLGRDTELAKAGAANASMRASLSDSAGAPMGDLTAFGAFKEGKLYLVYYFSTAPYAPQRDRMAVRLPGETTFLAFREKLIDRLK